MLSPGQCRTSGRVNMHASPACHACMNPPSTHFASYRRAIPPHVNALCNKRLNASISLKISTNILDGSLHIRCSQAHLRREHVQAAASSQEGPSLSGLGPSSGSETPSSSDAGNLNQISSTSEYVSAQQQEQEQQPEGTAPEVVEASSIIEEQQEEGATHYAGLGPLHSPPEELQNFASAGYTALAAVYGLVGLAVAAIAVMEPLLLLPVETASPLTLILLGCSSAVFLRAAAMALFLKESVDVGELLTLRHQRNNALLGVFALCALASQVPALAASPVLSGAVIAVSAVTLAVCGNVLRATLKSGLALLQWSFNGEDLGATIGTCLGFLQRDISTAAGILCLVTLAVCAYGLVGALPTAGFFAYEQVDWALRYFLSAGLLLSAAIAHSLLEFATYIRGQDVLKVIEQEIIDRLRTFNKVALVVDPPPQRFWPLNLTTLLAAAITGWFLLQAPELGVDVNADAALWGPQYWLSMLGAVYSAVTLFFVDWSTVKLWILRIFDFGQQLVFAVFNTFVMRWDQLTVRRE